MAEILAWRDERIDDVPLIIGLAKRLKLAEILNKHLGTHGLQQGLHNGQLAVGWLGYILSQADHRKSAVREWAHQALPDSLAHLLGQPLRAVDFSDDRLGGVLRRLSDDEAWAGIEQELWQTSVMVYDLPPLRGVRLDSTTSYGHHQVTDEGVMQRGHSKDHRPDLPQVKLMAAAAEPQGQLIACDVVAGQRADDPLYTPLIQRVRSILGRSGLLYVGDCKMSALGTRAELVQQPDQYLVPLPQAGERGRALGSWIDAIVDGTQPATLIWDGARLLGGGYEFTRPQQARVPNDTGAVELAWTERVQVIRSQDLAQTQTVGLEQRLQHASRDLLALTPAPGRGKRIMRAEAALQQAIQTVLARHAVEGLLTVTWERHETSVQRQQGRGRPGPTHPTYTQTEVRYRLTGVQRNPQAIAACQARLGWRVQVTNAPSQRLSLTEAVCLYRGAWVLEHDFHLIKDLPLGLAPMFVWKDDQIKGLVRLLTLALRLLTLIEIQVRKALVVADETLSGLYESQPKRETQQPTGKRLLRAFARAQISLICLETPAGTERHVTPLPPLLQQILHYLRLPLSLYTALAFNSS